MRSFNSGGICSLNSNPSHLFERSQNSLRQRSFGRARGITGSPLKRPRNHDSESDEDNQRYPGRRTERRSVFDGFKRMRVSSPSESPRTDVDSAMTDEEAATPRTTWRANKAIVPAAPQAGKKRPLFYNASASDKLPWKTMRQAEYMGFESSIEIPSGASCRTMVVFDPYRSITLKPTPRVDLVDDEKASASEAGSTECDDEPFLRFEELPEDNDEPVDMDID